MEINKKKLLGYLYIMVIVLFIVAVYYSVVVDLYFMNREIAFGGTLRSVLSWTFLILFHLFLALIVYCYLMCVMKNPGRPPKFWVD